ncbi:MAG: helix-turn-helix domain-containing protein, partial [Clostridia bacterium]|nr:helix-turn-helix domain-containing protein [Clostridia bacterium]
YWKNGKTQPTVDSLYKISKALNCSIDFVIGRE